MLMIFFLIGITGLAMVFFGIKKLMEGSNYSNKIISELKLSGNAEEINIEQAGAYSVCIVGTMYVKNLGNFGTRITGGGNELKVTEVFPKFKFRYKGKIATEFYKFEIANAGIYQLGFTGLEDLEVKYSTILPEKIFQTRVTIEDIKILVKDSSPASDNILTGLLSVVFGLIIVSGATLLAFNPEMLENSIPPVIRNIFSPMS